MRFNQPRRSLVHGFRSLRLQGLSAGHQPFRRFRSLGTGHDEAKSVGVFVGL